jgi:hypothetical protein
LVAVKFRIIALTAFSQGYFLIFLDLDLDLQVPFVPEEVLCWYHLRMAELEGTVAAVLSEVLNISVSSTGLAKQIVAAARKGTIESFAKVCASFGKPLPPVAPRTHSHSLTSTNITTTSPR